MLYNLVCLSTILFVGLGLGVGITISTVATLLLPLPKNKSNNITIVTDATSTKYDYIKHTFHYNLALDIVNDDYDFVEDQDVDFSSSILKTFDDSINEVNAVFKDHRDRLSQILNDNRSGVVKLKLRSGTGTTLAKILWDIVTFMFL